MKKLASLTLTFLLSILPLAAQQGVPGGMALQSRVAGKFVASVYNQWSAKVLSGNAATGSGTITLYQGYVTLPDGRVIIPFNVNAPITLDYGGNQETVTPTAVSGCGLTALPGACSITATFANTHPGSGTPVFSGTSGLQEAINDASSLGGGAVVVDKSWPGTTANITAAAAFSSVMIEDVRGPAPQYYAGRPSAVTLIAAPAAPTLTAVTGSLTSGAYKGTVAYVDALGGISLDSAESAATATTTGVTFASPAASTGAVGYLPRISTAGGSANEILIVSPLTSANCVLSTLESVIPACAIGATATITAANPSGTAKPSVEANAFTTLTYQAFSGLPPAPVVTSYPFGIWVATATLNASNADAAQFVVPAGYFNKLGGTWDVCVKGATATQVASSLLTVNLTMAAEYAQSPVTVSTVAFPTQTQAAAGTFEGCWEIQTAVTGTSGKFWSSTPFGPWHNFLTSAPATQVVSADVTAAASSAINLTKQLYVAVNLQAANANNITVPIVNSVSIIPRQ